MTSTSGEVPAASASHSHADTPPQSKAPENDDDGDDDSDSDYVTASESESDDTDQDEQDEETRRREREARAAERQRVLQAAGLIIKEESQPPPRPARSRGRRRPPAPAVPERSPKLLSSPHKELPPVPDSELPNNSLRLDDAFERYEAFRQSHLSMNRLSMASVDSSLSVSTSPTAPSFVVMTPTTSEPGESRTHSSSFLHFFGRSRTPANDGEAPSTRPVISAPILQREPSPSPEADAAFGSSWASLVDKSALEGIPSGERRRQEAIFELIVTEAAYIRDLQLIVEHFYTNVYSLLDEKARTVVFANVEDILLMNTTFLSSLEERQKDCRLYIDRIGDILKTSMANLGVYMDYCVNQATAIKVLQSLRQSNPELSACLQRLRDDPTARNLDLSSYLLVPMQRITRYPLLYKQIIHYTEAGEDRDDIEQAQHIAQKVLEHINETIREQEGRERLKEISKDLWVGQGRLDLTAPTRYMGPRMLVKEGVLLKAKSGRKLRAFLCNDILVLTEDATKSLYRMPLSLAEVEVREASGGRDELAFQLAVAYPRGGDVVALRATSARDCQLWMQVIHSASKRCREAQRRATRRSRG